MEPGIVAMKLMGALIAAVIAGASAASGQPVPFPCALVCFPPSHLNAKKCVCEEALPKRPACSLVCLDPQQTLDARKCACVRRPR
jgi:hypothetical protein